MKKITVLFIIVIASVLALLFQILFGSFLSARLATLPLVRNLDLFNPRAPIVVNNRETVRVSDANDAVETADSVKSKLAVVVYYDGKAGDNHLVRSGGAINWTADGYFVSTAAALSVPNKTYAVILNDGEIFPIKQVYSDTASSLVILATDARNLSTIEPVANTELRSGQKMLLLLNTVSATKTSFLESYMRTPITDVSGVVFNSDRVGRTVSLQSVGPLTPGQAVVNLDGKLAGLWDGTSVIASDAVSLFANDFFKDNMQVLRPTYGFSYVQLSDVEARALQLSAGAQVKDLVAGGAAAFGGLLKGDIITTVNGQKLDDSILFERLLAQEAPGDVMTLSVQRAGQPVSLTISPKVLEQK